MSQDLDNRQLRIQPADSVRVRAAKVALKAARRLQRQDDETLVQVIRSAESGPESAAPVREQPARKQPARKQPEMVTRDKRGSRQQGASGAARDRGDSFKRGSHQKGASGGHSGTVKWFNEEKGFGFIAQDGGGPDVFVHYSAIASAGAETLVEAQRVEFEVVQTPQGEEARDIRPL